MKSTLVVLVWLVSSTATSVAAQPNTEDPSHRLDEAARASFDAGQAAFARGEYEEALRAFASSYDLSARPELLFNMATCHARLQEPRDALARYEGYLEAVPDAENRAFVEAQIARMRRAVASAPAAPAEQADVSKAEPPSRAPAWIAFGVGAAGAITFAVAGALALASHDTLAACRPTASCEPGESDRGQRRALVADIGLGTAIAGSVVGVILWLVTNPDAPSDDGSARLGAEGSADGAVVHLSGRF